MFYNHPFGSWTEGQQSSTSSVYGALPYPTDANMTAFYFTNFTPNIFNATVVGPKAQVFYRIVTDNQMPGYTIVKNAEGGNVSLIEWQNHPFIEIRGMVAKQNVTSWLRLSPNQDSRLMDLGGVRYAWVPRNSSINLYATSSGTPAFCGRVTRSNGGVVLELTAEALQRGLLDVVVTACLLLQCGRNID
ncbi:hypothetical protein FA15DRAFT_654254 [Coprinopsis marcescibilis]|uniref:DUF6593 domain-containing protein n=1 Tax=Coprinopsis marcescibilis TaxID=230819 RepID=A0A5C3LDT0_COPMA|nr:hypothetical protein FA15DRAFT_654254 [Coprinopsis marcescibilis]